MQLPRSITSLHSLISVPSAAGFGLKFDACFTDLMWQLFQCSAQLYIGVDVACSGCRGYMFFLLMVTMFVLGCSSHVAVFYSGANVQCFVGPCFLESICLVSIVAVSLRCKRHTHVHMHLAILLLFLRSCFCWLCARTLCAADSASVLQCL